MSTWRTSGPGPGPGRERNRSWAASAGGALPPVKGEELRQATSEIALLLKGRRKLTPEALWEFLRTGGASWFRLLDFEARFKIE